MKIIKRLFLIFLSTSLSAQDQFDQLIDIRTIHVITGSIFLFLCITLIYFYFTRKTYAGFHKWTLGYVLGGFGLLLISFQGYLPVIFSVFLADTFIIILFFTVVWGIADFSNYQIKWPFVIFPILILSFFLVIFTFVYPSVSIRITIISGSIGLLCLFAAWIASVPLKKIIPTGNGLITGTMILLGITLLTRGTVTLIFDNSIIDYMNAGIMQSIILMVSCISSVLITNGLIIINSQRLEAELKNAIQEIRTLQGFIPICANCQKVRNDQGYWNQIEEYITHHTDMELSHSICPDCLKELYPDLIGQIDE
ncbi:MAG: hypothetical protein MJB14_08205 [Spirochaetes bacterium]|nr:hypothetical protein [Spirochaetota bacterium]